jgi:hypothetical protein
MISPGGLLLVVPPPPTDLKSLSVSVVWVGLQKSQITTLENVRNIFESSHIEHHWRCSHCLKFYACLGALNQILCSPERFIVSRDICGGFTLDDSSWNKPLVHFLLF